MAEIPTPTLPEEPLRAELAEFLKAQREFNRAMMSKMDNLSQQGDWQGDEGEEDEFDHDLDMGEDGLADDPYSWMVKEEVVPTTDEAKKLMKLINQSTPTDTIKKVIEGLPKYTGIPTVKTGGGGVENIKHQRRLLDIMRLAVHVADGGMAPTDGLAAITAAAKLSYDEIEAVRKAQVVGPAKAALLEAKEVPQLLTAEDKAYLKEHGNNTLRRRTFAGTGTRQGPGFGRGRAPAPYPTSRGRANFRRGAPQNRGSARATSKRGRGRG